MSRSTALILAAAFTFFCAASSSPIGAQTVTTYNNLGPGDSYLDGSQGGDPPLTVGGDASVQANAIWAMPFTPSVNGGVMSDIYIAVASCEEFVSSQPIQVFVLPDNEIEGISYGPHPVSPLVYSEQVFVQSCQCINEDCPCEGNVCEGPVLLHIPLNPNWPDPVVNYGQRYWLILSESGFPLDQSRWHLNDQGDTGDGVGRAVSFDNTGTWTLEPSATLGAFKIDVFGANDCPPESVPTLGGDCAVEDFVSACYYRESEQGVHQGFALNFNPFQGFGPADYPPRTLDPIASSLPLVSREVARLWRRRRSAGPRSPG